MEAVGVMKLVHAADLHLDSPLSGLERYEGAPVERIRGATRRALSNLVQLCLEEDAKLLLLAGDLYDGSWKDYSTGLFFSQQMARLAREGCRVAWIRGNHDAASQITQHLVLPEGVTELPFKKPGTVRYEDLGIAVHGQGFKTREVTERLAESYPEPEPGALNIGLLHTSLSGRPGHAPYAPCTADMLSHRGYDYWALGHVHAREVVSERPFIVFPGNLQGRHARETGDKGATVVSVDGRRVAGIEHRALDVVRWGRLEVNAAECASLDDVLERVGEALAEARDDAEGRLLCVRLEITGASRAHAELERDPEALRANVLSIAGDVGARELWVEKVRVETRPPSDLSLGEDVVGQVARAFAALQGDDAAVAELAEELAPLLQKLPAELKSAADGRRHDDPNAVTQALADAERMVLTLLTSGGRS